MGFYRILAHFLPSFIQFHCVLPSVTEFYLVLLSLVLIGYLVFFYSFTNIYWVLVNVSYFYRVSF